MPLIFSWSFVDWEKICEQGEKPFLLLFLGLFFFEIFFCLFDSNLILSRLTRALTQYDLFEVNLGFVCTAVSWGMHRRKLRICFVQKFNLYLRMTIWRFGGFLLRVILSICVIWSLLTMLWASRRQLLLGCNNWKRLFHPESYLPGRQSTLECTCLNYFFRIHEQWPFSLVLFQQFHSKIFKNLPFFYLETLKWRCKVLQSKIIVWSIWIQFLETFVFGFGHSCT